MQLVEASQVAIVPEEPDASAADLATSQRLAWHAHLALLVISLGILAIAGLLDVSGQTRVTLPLIGISLPELCYWRRMVGMDCPGCGLTRCFVSLAHFDVAAAWGYNPVGILCFAAVLFQLPYRGLQLWRISSGRRPWDLPWLCWGVLVLSVLLIVQWLARVVWA